MNATILPILLPLLTAVFTLLWSRPGTARRFLAVGSALLQLGVALRLVALTSSGGRLVLPLGGWPARFGIVLVTDLLAAIMVTLCTVTTLATLLYGFAEAPARKEHPLRLPLIGFMVTGINLSFLTGDLFNLFVAFEILLIASYALLTLECRGGAIRHAFPYLTINLVGGALFFCAAGLAYGLFGTLNLAAIAAQAGALGGDARFRGLAVLLLGVFALKAGLFPLYFWLPRAYPILPAPLAALFSGMLTKVGVYALLRFMGTVFPPEMGWLSRPLAWLAGATMLLGVFGAISRTSVRGILSYHILSQIGYMVLAIALFTPLSLAAAVFYLIHHIVVKSSLFLIGGAAASLNESDELDAMGGLWKKAPFLGVLFLLQAFSLAGVPPLSGFWGKFLILKAAFGQEAFVLAGVALLAGLLTLLSMLKIWDGAFWKEPHGAAFHWQPRRTGRMIAVAAGMTLISLGIGLGAEPVFHLSRMAAESATDRAGYIHDVRAALNRFAP